MKLLELSGLVAGHGRAAALDRVSLAVEPGEIVALLGANGAGKTTTLRTISGLIKPWAGGISFAGQDITGASPCAVARLGIAHVPEGRRVFPGLTVRENIMLGAANRGFVAGRALASGVAEMLAIFPALEALADVAGWTLSGGQQQMVALARGLMARPRLLLLDEPSLGLAPLVVQQVFRVIKDINQRGTSVLLVEQNAHMALSVASRGYVLETGRIVAEGTSDALRDSEQVRTAYLGAVEATGPL